MSGCGCDQQCGCGGGCGEIRDEIYCVKCYKPIPKRTGYVLIPGRISPEVPCCVACYNEMADTRNRGIAKLRKELEDAQP